MSSPPPPPLASPLTPEHLTQLARAQTLYRPISRARRYARFEAWTLMIFGAISFVTGLTSPAAIFIGLALCFTGFFELKTSERLANLDPAAPRLLALNQVALALSLIIYSCWQLFQLHRHPFSLAALDPAASQLGDTSNFDEIGDLAYRLLYYILIAVAVFFQGFTALYYNSRQKHVATYLAEVPEWARTLALQTRA